MKIEEYSRLVIMMDKLLRLIFCLSIILALFLNWFPGMIGPHPIESEVSGWMTFLLSPFFVLLLTSDLSRMGLFEITTLVSLIIILWSAPVLSLLNLLLCIRRSGLFIWTYRILLMVSISIMGVAAVIATPSLFVQGGGLLLGFWAYMGLLFIQVVYEVIFYITIQKRGF